MAMGLLANPTSRESGNLMVKITAAAADYLIVADARWRPNRHSGTPTVIPAQAGIYGRRFHCRNGVLRRRIPACAGMTGWGLE